jgi:hypothetical protein
MGFWHWLFKIRENGISEEERALRRELEQKVEERRITELYNAFVREALLDPTADYGFAMKINASHESIILDAVDQYATRPYTIYRTSTEEMDDEGLCRIHVAYIQVPLSKQVVSNHITTTHSSPPHPNTNLSSNPLATSASSDPL